MSDQEHFQPQGFLAVQWPSCDHIVSAIEHKKQAEWVREFERLRNNLEYRAEAQYAECVENTVTGTTFMNAPESDTISGIYPAYKANIKALSRHFESAKERIPESYSHETQKYEYRSIIAGRKAIELAEKFDKAATAAVKEQLKIALERHADSIARGSLWADHKAEDVPIPYTHKAHYKKGKVKAGGRAYGEDDE